MRVKFRGKAGLETTIKYITDGNFDVWVRFDCANEIGDTDEPNTKSNCFFQKGRKENEGAYIFTTQKEEEIAFEADKVVLIKKLRVRNFLEGKSKYKYLIKLDNSNKLNNVEIEEDIILHLMIERRNMPINKMVEFSVKVINEINTEKEAIIEKFSQTSKSAEINNLSVAVDLKNNATKVFENLIHQKYIDRAKNIKGHVPLMGPKQYVYIDFMDWVSDNTNEEKVKEEFKTFFETFELNENAWENVIYDGMSTLPLFYSENHRYCPTQATDFIYTEDELLGNKYSIKYFSTGWNLVFDKYKTDTIGYTYNKILHRTFYNMRYDNISIKNISFLADSCSLAFKNEFSSPEKLNLFNEILDLQPDRSSGDLVLSGIEKIIEKEENTYIYEDTICSALFQKGYNRAKEKKKDLLEVQFKFINALDKNAKKKYINKYSSGYLTQWFVAIF